MYWIFIIIIRKFFCQSSKEIYLSDIDDEELDSYILSEKESQSKSALWNKVNADYLVQQKEKEEKRLKEKEEGKNEKKKRKTVSRKNKMPANTASKFTLIFCFYLSIYLLYIY